jgi:hypothetical protein
MYPLLPLLKKWSKTYVSTFKKVEQNMSRSFVPFF